MSAPIPRDPRQLSTTPDQVDQKVAEILNQPTSDLAEEYAQLDAAHLVLRDALQEN